MIYEVSLALDTPFIYIFSCAFMIQGKLESSDKHICHAVMGPDIMVLVFLMLSFKPAFSLSSFTP